jgi:hypothetical protein
MRRALESCNGNQIPASEEKPPIFRDDRHWRMQLRLVNYFRLGRPLFTLRLWVHARICLASIDFAASDFHRRNAQRLTWCLMDWWSSKLSCREKIVKEENQIQD